MTSQLSKSSFVDASIGNARVETPSERMTPIAFVDRGALCVVSEHDGVGSQCTEALVFERDEQHATNLQQLLVKCGVIADERC